MRADLSHVESLEQPGYKNLSLKPQTLTLSKFPRRITFFLVPFFVLVSSCPLPLFLSPIYVEY